MYRSNFSDFASRFGKDNRFKGIDKMKERESLFNEYILEIRKQQKEKSQQKLDKVCILILDNHHGSVKRKMRSRTSSS